MIKHLSHSSVQSWMDCGERFRLQKIERVPNKPMWAGVGGTAVHHATEALDLADFGKPSEHPSTFQEAFEIQIAEEEEKSGFAREEWNASGRPSKEYPDKQGYKWWSEHGQAMVDVWRAFLRNGVWQVAIIHDEPAVEVHFEGVVIGGKPVTGYIDRVLEDIRRPEIKAVVDLKSGSMEPKSSKQLGAYHVLLKRALDVEAQWGFYFMNRKGITSDPVDLTVYRDGRLDLYYEKAWAAMEAGVFIPNPGNFCGTCGVKDYCREMGGAKHEEVRQYPLLVG